MSSEQRRVNSFLISLYGHLRKYLGEVFRDLALQKESKDSGRILGGRSCSYAYLDFANVSRFAGCRIHQGKKRDDAASAMKASASRFRFLPFFIRTSYAFLPQTLNNASMDDTLYILCCVTVIYPSSIFYVFLS